MKKIYVIAASLILTLQGCAITTQDSSLAKRTAQSLGVDKEQVIISDVEKGALRVDYKAKVGGAMYGCYVTVAGITSDAMCVKRGVGKKMCDALSKAAGRCS